MFYGVFENLDYFLLGAAKTVMFALPGALIGVIIGLALMLLKESKFLPFKMIGVAYTLIIRGTPLLVQIFVFYYVLPKLIGVDFSPAFAGLLALAFNSAAYSSEILKSGLDDIPRGQYEAARTLGLKRWQTFLWIITPQVLVRVIPPLTNEFILLFKATPVLSVIAVVELTRSAQEIINMTYNPVGVYLFIALVYYCIISLMALVSARLESWSMRVLS